ncbi:MAG: DUF1801 domain-containing protein [Parvibaculum sp.]
MSMVDIPFQNKAVKGVYADYAPPVRQHLLTLRALIFETASKTKGVGPLEETLKWGQPSYLTLETESGTTIRIDQLKGTENGYALFVHCQTDLVDHFRAAYGDQLHCDGNRALHFSSNEKLPRAAVRHCIALALTYHLNKAARRKKTYSSSPLIQARMRATPSSWINVRPVSGIMMPGSTEFMRK